MAKLNLEVRIQVRTRLCEFIKIMALISLQGRVAHSNAEKYKSLLRRLFTSPYEDRKNRNPQRVEGTCEWFASNPLFRGWHQRKGSALLWVSADPGCGKSVLARYLVDELLQSAKSHPKTICYFFFKDDFEDQKSPESAICCILRQLFMQKPNLLSNDIFDKFEEDGEAVFTSFASLWNIFTGIASHNKAGEIICIVDALDECRGTGISELVKALDRLYNATSNKTNLKFLVTSRPYLHIQRNFQALKDRYPTIHLAGEDQIQVDKISQEIDIVIRKRVEELGTRLELRKEEKQSLKDELSINTNRTYLWVYLVFEVINESITLTEGKLRATIRNLPQSVNEAYDRILRKSRDKDLARKLLHIIIAAERPLSLQEASIALAIKEHHHSCLMLEPDLEPESRFSNMIREACGLFVTIKDSRIFLLHQTAKEFLTIRHTNAPAGPTAEWQNSFNPVRSHRILSESCIWYLLFDEFKDPSWYGTYAFLDYAAENWAAHFRKSYAISYPICRPKTEALALQLCTDRRSPWFEIYWRTTTYDQPKYFTPLMLTSYFGLDVLFRQLYKGKYAALTSRDSTYGRSALSWASENGHDLVVERLLSRISKGAVLLRDWTIRPIFRYWTMLPTMVNSKDENDHTPLWYAAANGHENVVKMLLRKGAKVSAEDKWGQTPLSWAAHNGHEAIVGMLLEKGAKDSATDLNIRGNDGLTVLSRAVSDQNEAVVELLIEKGANMEVPNHIDETPLLLAAKSGYESIVEMLLKMGANMNAEDRHGDTPLQLAAIEGHTAVVELLLQHHSNIKIRNGTGQTLLSLAAERGHTATVDLLLKRGANTEDKDVKGWTPLWFATAKRHLAVTELLLDKGANMEAKNEDGCTPLSLAAAENNVAIAELLLDKGANIEAEDDAGLTPLVWAAAEGHTTIVGLLLEKGANTEAKDNHTHWTPLWLATAGNHPTVVKLLLDMGANIEAEDKDGWTPLSMAAGKRHRTVMEILLQRGAIKHH